MRSYAVLLPPLPLSDVLLRYATYVTLGSERRETRTISLWLSLCRSRIIEGIMPRQWPRVVAAFLILWALADLTVPGICGTDAPLPSTQTTTALSAVPAGNASRSQESNREDDCFCCCTHIVPAPHSELSASLVDQGDLFSFAERGPHVYLSTPYPPPRS